MAGLPGTQIPNGSPLVLPDVLDQGFTHYSHLGRGGWHNVLTLDERNAISDEKREVGLACYVAETDVQYVLAGGTTNGHWLDVQGALKQLAQGLADQLTALTLDVGGMQTGDSFVVPGLVDLPATTNATGVTRFATVYADGTTDNNGRYWQADGTSLWTKVAGDLSGRTSSLETFQSRAAPYVPHLEGHPDMLEMWVDGNRRPFRVVWADGTTSLRLAADSVPTISYSNLATGVRDLLPNTEVHDGILWMLRDANKRPLLWFDDAGKATLRLAAATVTGPMLADASVAAAKLADGAVSHAKLDAGLQSGLPTLWDYNDIMWMLQDANKRPLLWFDDAGKANLRLAAATVTGPMLADGAVGRAKLDAESQSGIPTLEDYGDVLWMLRDANKRPLVWFSSGGRANLRLADAAVTGPMLADAAVTAAKLGDGAVSLAKLDAGLQAGLPALDDITGVLMLWKDANDRPILWAESDGTLRGKFAVALDNSAILAGVEALRGWSYGGHHLRHSRLKLARIRAAYSDRYSVIVLGDSQSALPDRFPGWFAKLLQAEYGGTAVGWWGPGYHVTAGANGCVDRLKVASTVPDSAWDRSEVGDGAVYAPDCSPITSSTPGVWLQVEVLQAQPSPKLYFHRLPGGGTFRWQVNGGAWTSVSTDGADGLGSTTVTIPSAACTIRIEVETGGTAGVSITGLSFTTTTGVTVHKWARAGSTAANFADRINPAFFQECVAAVDPQLAVLMWGTNEQFYNTDPAAMVADLLTLVSWIRTARPLCDILLMSAAESQQETEGHAYGIRQYRDAVRTCAVANGFGFLDCTEIIGPFAKSSHSTDGSTLNLVTSDGIHINPTTGGVMIGESAYNLVTQRA